MLNKIRSLFQTQNKEPAQALFDFDGKQGLGVVEGLPVKGKVQIYFRDARGEGESNLRIGKNALSWDELKDGGWELEYETENLIVDSGKVLMARMMMEDSGWDTGITYCEVGTNATAPAAGDTNIGAVTKRNAITRYVRVSNRVQFRTFFAAADVTADLKATGLYGHSTATATNQTGELFNHAKINFDNTSGTKDITVLIEVTFG